MESKTIKERWNMASLVIVESPGKIGSIEKYLNQVTPGEYKVMASYGHICDLPNNEMGFSLPDYQAKYVISESKAKQVNNLRKAVQSVDRVILATDLDREGEAIAWHLKRILKLTNPSRIVFNEITKPAISQALKDPKTIDMKKVAAQETRRLLDRVIGFTISPVLSDQLQGNYSAGRVQSVVLWLIVDLERKIRTFISTRHYGVKANFFDKEKDLGWNANWDPKTWLEKGDTYWIDREAANEVSKIKSLQVTSFEDTQVEKAPPAPFTTSTFQQACSVQLKLDAKKAMEIAQKLYEQGFITYMRTDNPNLSAEAIAAIRQYATQQKLPLPDQPRTWSTKANAQEAHEAIRASDINLLKVSDDMMMQKVYQLIWLRTLGCQLASAKYDVRQCTLTSPIQIMVDGKLAERIATFKATGSALIFDGWKIITRKQDIDDADDDDDPVPNNPIPPLLVGQKIDVQSMELLTKNTEPPKRYTQARLTKKLDELGIGRPSTYASIFSTLMERDYYTEGAKRLLYASEKGEKAISELEGNFHFLDIKYTAEMETNLDLIAGGELPWKDVLRTMHESVTSDLKSYQSGRLKNIVRHQCQICKNDTIVKRQGKSAAYWTCVQPGCKNILLDDNNKPGQPKPEPKLSEYKCEECNRPLIQRSGVKDNKAWVFWGCSGFGMKVKPCKTSYPDQEGKPDYSKARKAK